MLCPRCLLRSRSALRVRPGSAAPPGKPARAFTTTAAAPSAAPRQGAPDSSHNPPAATSTSAAQPFSTPLSPSPAALGIKPGRSAASPSVLVRSSVPAGTTLRGLNFYKNKTDPVALEDSEYPAWLWAVLTPDGSKDEAAVNADLFSKSKKQRRLAAKRLRKQASLNPDIFAPKVPVYEQSVNLPSGDGSIKGSLVADKARQDLTRAMRTKRRSQIKEANFLKAMG